MKTIALIATSLLVAGGTSSAATTVRLSVNDPLIPQLAVGLGAFSQEGIQVEFIKVEDVSTHDYLMQEPLVGGRLDASYHWFQHVVFGNRHQLPLKAVMMVNDAPGMKVMVANRVKDQIRSAADFKGRNVAEGAGYATKSLITGFLARQAGLPPRSYTPVMIESDGRREAVLQGLKEGTVDVMSFMEPMTSAIEETGMVTTLYDLTSADGTRRALGDVWPAHTVFLSAKYIGEHPDTVQRLVNAFVRTMRFVNSHTAEQIAEKLPASYFEKRDRKAEITRIRKLLPGFARGDFRVPASAAKMMTEAIVASDFDESEEGRWRATGAAKLRVEDLFDNRFVEKAMKEIK